VKKPAAKKSAAKKSAAKKSAAKKTVTKTGIFAHYLALYAKLTRKVPCVAVWTGTIRFPRGALAKWSARKHRYEEAKVAATLDRFARDVREGLRFLDLRVEGDTVEIVGWDWRDDWETLNQSLAHALEAGAALEPKGKIQVFARWDDGSCTWVSYTFAGKKLDVAEGDAKWESERMQKALATVGPRFEEWLRAHPDTRTRFERSGLYGYVDRSGREVFPPEFERAYEVRDGIANVQDERGARLLDIEKGLLPGVYFTTDYHRRGLVPVAVQQDRYGYVDRAGVLRIPAEFTRAEPFEGPLAVVAVGRDEVKRWITPAGELVGDPIAYTHGFTEDLAWVYDYERKSYGCIDGAARPAFERRFHAAGAFSEGLAAIVDSADPTKSGYCDCEGNVVIHPRFDEAHPFSEGRAAVRVGKEFHLVDRSGAFVGRTFDGIASSGMSEGMIAVRLRGKVGFLDRDGELAVPARYQEAHGFFEDRAYVAVAEQPGRAPRWGHIDRQGKLVVPATLEWTHRYDGGLACAKQDGLYGYIDREGRWVIPPRYKSMQPRFSEGLAFAQLP